jgi:hypothetical protein
MVGDGDEKPTSWVIDLVLLPLVALKLLLGITAMLALRLCGVRPDPRNDEWADRD